MKRASENQITKDDRSDDSDDNGDSEERKSGTFQRASEEVLSTRKILKVRRGSGSSSASVPVTADGNHEKDTSSAGANPFQVLANKNISPFATVSLATEQNKEDTEAGSTNESKLASDENTNRDTPKKDVGEALPENVAKASVETASVASTAPSAPDSKEEAPKFPKFSFGGSTFGTATGSTVAPAFTFGSLASSATAKPFDFAQPFKLPDFGSSGSGSLFGASSVTKKPDSANVGEEEGEADEDPQQEVPIGPANPILPEQDVKNGEEDEEELFRAKCKAYRFDASAWKECGVGPLKLNKHKETGKIRLIMRAEGSMRVLLNFALFPEFKLDEPNEKSSRFIGFDEVKKPCSYLVKFGSLEDKKKFHSQVQSILELSS